MKNLFCVIITIFIFSATSFPGDLSKTGTARNSSFSIPSGYGIKLLNGLGNSRLINSTSNLGFMNPASIGSLPNLAVGLTYQVNTPVYFPEPYDDIKYNRVYNFIPQSFGAVFNYDAFTFGLSLGQEFNTTIDFGEIPITTPEFPDGTGTVYTPIIETSIENYSLSVAYNLGNSLVDNADISLGLRYTLNRLNVYEKIDKAEVNISNFTSSIEAAVLIKFELMQFGLSFNSGKSFIDQTEELTPAQIPGTRTGYFEIQSAEIENNVPPEINLDALFQLNTNLKLAASINNVFWSSNYSPFTNQFDISSNLIYDPLNKLSGSLGLLLSNCFLEENYDNEYNALFIMMGLKLNVDKFNIDFALADSHLISGELRKQLIAKVGVGLQL